MSSLALLGWDAALADAFQPFSASDFVPARVALEHKDAYELLAPGGEFTATCTGKLRHTATVRADLPAVGDWVVARLRPGEAQADIHAVLPRRTKFSRAAAGDAASEQLVAANIDTVFLVTALDQNFNLRRIERYLTVAWASGAQPVVVLNKADLHPDPAAARNEVTAIAPGVPVIALSALPHLPPPAAPVMRWDVSIETSHRTPPRGLEQLAPWLLPGRTVALLGSSGVGKSTLINGLLGRERQSTGAISDAVGKGRHTTTHRELIVSPSGALVLDTPGMRELQLWDVDATALDQAFDDIATLAAQCKFRDCTHRAEPACAIQAALDDGSLDFGRWQSFQKLQREQAYAARKADPRLARESKADWKKLHHQARMAIRMKHGE